MKPEAAGKPGRKRLGLLSKAKHATRILSTIDQLHDRKSRPDLDRICHMVQRQHGISPEQTRAELGLLLSENLVVKVDYKGSTSYRNAAKWRRRRRLLEEDSALGRGRKTVVNSKLRRTKTGRRVMKAVKNLMKDGPVGKSKEMSLSVIDNGNSNDASSKEKGIRLEQVEKWIREKWGADQAETMEAIKIAVAAEVERGYLVELSSGRYTLQSESSGVPIMETQPRRGPGRVKNDESKVRSSLGKAESLAVATATEDVQASTSSGTADATPSGAASPKKIGGRRKKLRKSVEADIDSLVATKKSRLDPALAADSGTKSAANSELSLAVEYDPNLCTYCQSMTNRSGGTEDFLVCKDCTAKAHPTCMDMSEELARRAARSPWQCCNCKTCNVCNDSGDPDEMLFCDACDKGYHTSCHQPPVLEKPTGKWVCCRCVLELGAETVSPDEGTALEVNTATDSKSNADCGGTSFLPTPSDSPVHFQEEIVSKEGVVKPEPMMSDAAATAVAAVAAAASTASASASIVAAAAALLPRLSTTLTGDVPDASNWSVAEVAKFFADIGFVEQAETFRAEEVDGKALLLMTRNDVLTGMAFKLGPALKIYAHVKRLQTYDAGFIR